MLIYATIILLLKLGFTLSFLHIHRRFIATQYLYKYNLIQTPNRYYHDTNTGSIHRRNNDNCIHMINEKSNNDAAVDSQSNESLKREALLLLDCLTSPRDQDDPQYDVEKDVRRDELLLSNDYNELKSELRARGLKTSGDKLEMITRLLLHIIDPSIKFDQMSGLEANLKYVDASDIDSKKIRIVPESERLTSIDDSDPDADDLILLKKKAKIANSPRNIVGGGGSRSNPSANPSNRVIMDGLSRKETSFLRLQVRSTSETDPHSSRSSSRDKTRYVCSYVVSSKDVLRNWAQNAHVIIFLPSEVGWRSKAMRILADEMAFTTQSIVVIPDIYDGIYYSKQRDIENSQASLSAIHLLMEESLSRLSSGDYDDTSSSSSSIESFSSKCTNTMKEWLDIQSYRNTSIFEGILSSIRYAQSELGARSISIAGVGYGAGKGLESVCYIHDLARLAQYEEILTSYLQYQIIIKSKEEVEPYVKESDDDDNDDLICAKIKSILNHQDMNQKDGKEELDINAEAAAARLQKHHTMQYKLIKEKIIKYHSVFIKPSKKLFELTLDKRANIDEDDSSMEESMSAMLKQYSTTNSTNTNSLDNNNNNDLFKSTYAEDNVEVLEEDELDYFSDIEINNTQQSNSSIYNSNSVNNDDNINDMKYRIDEVIQNSLQTNYTNSITNERELQIEWDLIVASAKRAREKELFFSESATISLSDFLALVPKAVFALSPSRFDTSLVANCMYNAAFLVYHTTGEVSEEAAKHMYKAFDHRKNEIFDYCFRIYQLPVSTPLQTTTTTTTTASSSSSLSSSLIEATISDKDSSSSGVTYADNLNDDFLYAPRTEYAMKCSQEAFSMGAMWLDAYSTIVIDDFTDGVGETKYDTTAYSVITENDLKEISLRPSAIAEYLHDDPDLFRNNRIN